MHRTNNRGFPVLDRKLKGIGRIKRTYGTDDSATIDGIRVMITTLYRAADFQPLEELRDGKMTLLQAYAKWKNHKTLPTAQSVLTFDPIVFDWLKSYTDIKEGTKEDYEHNYRQLLKVKKSFTLEELPDVLADYRKKCAKNKTHRQFNVTRNSVRSFLKNYLNEFHDIYQGVVRVKPLQDKVQRTEVAWSYQEIESVIKKLPPKIGAQFFTQCITGASMGEYSNGLVVEGDGVRVKGTKMARIDDRRNRLVPFVETPAPLVINVKRYRIHLKNASDGKMKPNDARHTFSRWCLDAGIPYERTVRYMGHAPKSMTARYAQSTMAQWLKEDGQKMKNWIEAQKSIQVNQMASKFFA